MNRGGSWNNDPVNARVSNRNNWNPDNRNHNLGFRLAHTGSRLMPDVHGRPARPRRACCLRLSLSVPQAVRYPGPAGIE